MPSTRSTTPDRAISASTLISGADLTAASLAADDFLTPETEVALASLLHTLETSAPTANPVLVERAARYAIAAHGADRRKSGEPYVIHPIAVAEILARIQLDSETIAGALLHDVVEDTEVTLEQIEEEFGQRIARLVDGVSKLGRIPWTGDDSESRGSREKAQQAENLRKMFLAMVDDIGVVLIKLADRLHNMRTLDALPPNKQARIAQQTLEIYAPLANRLGIWQFKSELEDLAFRYINPEAFAALTAEFAKRAQDSAMRCISQERI